MSLLLPVPAFWTTIDAARLRTARPGASAESDALQSILEPLPTDEVIGFVQSFERGLAALNTWELWGAGYTACGGMSDDGFVYFRSWVLGLGEQVFEVARTDPDALGPFLVEDEYPENEELRYSGHWVLEARGMDLDDVPSEECVFAEDTPRGQGWDPGDLPSLLPKLAARFGSTS